MKTLFIYAALVSASLTLAGCGGTNWVKPSSTEAGLNADTAQCQVMENQADNDETFDNCMRGKGWIEQ